MNFCVFSKSIVENFSVQPEKKRRTNRTGNWKSVCKAVKQRRLLVVLLLCVCDFQVKAYANVTKFYLENIRATDLLVRRISTCKTVSFWETFISATADKWLWRFDFQFWLECVCVCVCFEKQCYTLYGHGVKLQVHILMHWNMYSNNVYLHIFYQMLFF